MPGPSVDAKSSVFGMVLGVAQDAGIPQAGCVASCCHGAWSDPGRRRLPACLALVDAARGERFVIDCTPAFPEQLARLDLAAPGRPPSLLLTHAHMGHYTGLVHIGREAMACEELAVYAMPRMGRFLSEHAPWRELFSLGHARLVALAAGSTVALTPSLRVTPLIVPHRDELSETVAFRVDGPDCSLLYLPDIDSLEAWWEPLLGQLEEVDVAYLDATFYSADELPGRDMKEVSHPLLEKGLALFAPLPTALREKLRYIHINHTNPVLDPSSAAARAVRASGSRLAVELERVAL
jgi:pyrroloquinoline quinone biosynthesis protein B